MEQQVANLLQSLEIQPVPQVKCCYSTPFKTQKIHTLLSCSTLICLLDEYFSPTETSFGKLWASCVTLADC